MILREAAATRTGIGPSRGIEGVADLAVVGESIPEHESVPACQLVVELHGGLGFRAGCRKVIGIYAPDAQARKDAGGEEVIDRRGRSRGDEAVFKRAVMFLLARRVKKCSVLDDRASEGRSGAIAVEAGCGVLCFKRIACVQRAVLQEKKSV